MPETGLQRLMNDEGYTLLEISEAYRLRHGKGLHLRTVSRWARGESVPHPVSAVRLSRLLGVPADDLFGDVFRDDSLV